MIGRVNCPFPAPDSPRGGCFSVCMCSALRVHSSFLIVFFLILKMTLYLNIWWSVPQFAPRIGRVPQMLIFSRHLVMMKSIICPCRERGCVQVVLCASFCLNMVLVTIRSNLDPLIHLACNSEGESADTLVNTDCFNIMIIVYSAILTMISITSTLIRRSRTLHIIMTNHLVGNSVEIIIVYPCFI